MYRVIDTVSIDVVSIRDYYLDEKPREETDVERSRMAGDVRDVRLRRGIVRYRDIGTGPVLVFVHGVMANGVLWREVVAALSGRFRCIVLDLPLGGHSVAMRPEADLSPRGVARIVADMMEALDLRDVTLVGNDTGGAICQVVVTEHPGRVGRLVLTDCDAYDAFFPVLIGWLFRNAARFLGTRPVDFIAWMLRARFAQRALFRGVALRSPDDDTLDAYYTPLIHDAGVRRDLTKFLRGVSRKYTMEAARGFRGFERPVLIVWGDRDLLLPVRLAVRLKRDFPDARLEIVEGSRTFIPEDRPDRLVELIDGFLAEHTTAGARGHGA